MSSGPAKFFSLTYTALFLITPLIVMPWASELFEFNKMLFVLLLASIVGFSILIRLISNNGFVVGRTPWDFPLLLFFLSQVLSTIFSIDRHTSIWGYYSRFHGGLLSTLAYLILYYGLTSFLARDHNRSTAVRFLIRTILTSAILVTGYGFLQHPTPFFRNPNGAWRGIDADQWVQNVEERVFSTLGQPNWLAAYLAMTIPLTWYLLLRQSSFTVTAPENSTGPTPKFRNLLSSGSLKTVGAFCLSLLMFWVLLFTKSRAGLIGLGAGVISFGTIITLGQARLGLTKSSLTRFACLISVYLLLVAVSGQPLLKRFGIDFRFRVPKLAWAATEVAPGPIPDDTDVIRSIVWPGAITIFRHYPLFGSGVETFAYSYWQYRPAAHNLTSEWEFLYNRAHNEYLNLLATTGSAGITSYFVLVVVYLVWTIRKLFFSPPPQPATGPSGQDYRSGLLLLAALSAGFISGLVANFWGFSVVAVALLFYLYPGLSFCLGQEPPRLLIKLRLGRLKRPAQALVVIIFVLILIQIVKVFSADLLFAYGNRAAQLDNYQTSYQPLKIAIALRPDEPVYYDNLAFTASMLATATRDADRASTLAVEAISATQQALKLSPINVNYWKTAARVFSELASLDPSVYEQALLAINQAQNLAPTDPKLPYNRGLILLQQALGDDLNFVKEEKDRLATPEDEVQQAIDAFEQAIELKADYRDARYALAVTEYQLAVDETGQIRDQEKFNRALEQLKIILETTQPPDFEAGQKLKDWSRQNEG